MAEVNTNYIHISLTEEEEESLCVALVKAGPVDGLGELYDALGLYVDDNNKVRVY